MKIPVIVLLLAAVIWQKADAQKGEKYLLAGPLISFPIGSAASTYSIKPGVGLEAVGQFHISNKSALLLQTSWASYNTNDPYSLSAHKRLSIFVLGGGYQYYFSPGDIFANLLVGLDKDSRNPRWGSALRLGAGKSFSLKNNHFLNAGADLSFGDTYSRINLKALISLF